jgi:YD repeat-containing protein
VRIGATHKDKDNATTMTYHRFSPKTAMTDPDMGSWSYACDDNGNLTQRNDVVASQTETLAYDFLDHLTEEAELAAEGWTPEEIDDYFN